MKQILTKVMVTVLSAILAFGACSSWAFLQERRTIPYPPFTPLEGAAAYAGRCNHNNSAYFTKLDVYGLKSNQNLTILPRFRTYQQTTEVTCGPASALMVLYHYGNKSWTEAKIARIMRTHEDLDGDNYENRGEANERGEWGTSTDRMVKFFTQIGWKVQSSLTEGRLAGGKTFSSHEQFKEWLIGHLKQNTPVMVEWIDWMGHWQVIIGYDTMGTQTLGDDVIIFADPYDTSDHWQDGYYIYNAQRFFYMWEDKQILPESQQYQQWIIARP
ncbi:MAG TPA: C39 family peptidase [Bacillota bacterium]